jgi:phosphate transport system ATP-binding protein
MMAKIVEPAELQAASHSGIPADVAVRVRNFSASYGELTALRNINLDIIRRQVTAFIGASGCGKSTLLKWINRMNDLNLEAKASGTLMLGDQDVLSPRTNLVDLRRRVGMVFQEPNPFPKTIFDNVAFGPRLHFKMAHQDLEQLVEWALKKAALWEEVKDRLHRSALSLSGGQQQRLCIARAIAIGPEVLLMDEPCSALDPYATASIENLIFELSSQFTIIIVTHNMQQASRCSQRTAFFHQGLLIEEGETEQIFTRPKVQSTEEYVSGKFG